MCCSHMAFAPANQASHQWPTFYTASSWLHMGRWSVTNPVKTSKHGPPTRCTLKTKPQHCNGVNIDYHVGNRGVPVRLLCAACGLHDRERQQVKDEIGFCVKLVNSLKVSTAEVQKIKADLSGKQFPKSPTETCWSTSSGQIFPEKHTIKPSCVLEWWYANKLDQRRIIKRNNVSFYSKLNVVTR